MPSEIPFIHALDAWRTHRRHSATPDPPDAEALHEVFQNSTINALLEGVYDGSMTYGELRRHGDFGLGTFNALDGEMIAFDGEFYQIKSDGIAYPVADDQRTPFATVLFFRTKLTHALTGAARLRALASLGRGLDGGAEPVLRGAGRRPLRVGDDAERAPPGEAVPGIWPRWRRSSRFFISRMCGGTLAGFRFPDFTRGLNVPGIPPPLPDRGPPARRPRPRPGAGRAASWPSTPRPASTWSCRPTRPSCMPTWATTRAMRWTGPSGGSDPVPIEGDPSPSRGSGRVRPTQ